MTSLVARLMSLRSEHLAELALASELRTLNVRRNWAGDFDTWTLNTPFGSLQFATDGSIFTASYSFGRGLGLSASRYNVTTTRTGQFWRH